MDERGDALDRGFELAYFIFPDRALAIEILTGAYNKLHAQCRQAKKRNYWRDKYLKRWITRISPGDNDALQWLICFESDAYEMRQEQSGAQTLRDMVRRFVKTLVRSGTAMSSFYVNAGVGRLLHSYTTAETQQVYEVVSERYLGADEYRRAKRVLMNKLETRFSGFLTTGRAGYGEVRFEMLEGQERWKNYVHECLAAFTPWSTRNACLVPRNFSSGQDLPRLLTGKDKEATDSDAVETNRCHAFIDPICYEKLMTGLGLEVPEKKLALPRFNMQTNQNNGDKPDNSTGLTSQERQKIESTLVSEATRRRRATPQIARVLVDGEERHKLDLQSQNELRFDLAEGAELLEIWGADRVAADRSSSQNRFLLATHRVRYADAGGLVADSQRIVLGNNRELLLTISPYATAGAEGEYKATVFLKPGGLIVPDAAGRPFWSLHWAPAYAFSAALLIALGWGLATLSHRNESSADHNKIAFLEKQLATERAAHVSTETTTAAVAIPSFKLISDDMFTRGGNVLEQPVVLIPAEQPIVNLQLPVGSNTHFTYHAAVKPFLGGPEVLSEGQLKPEQTTAGVIVTLPLPASQMSDGQDYSVDLRYINAAGRLEENNTFTFHVVKRKK